MDEFLYFFLLILIPFCKIVLARSFALVKFLFFSLLYTKKIMLFLNNYYKNQNMIFLDFDKMPYLLSKNGKIIRGISQ